MRCGLKKLSVANARMKKGVQVCVKFGKILKRNSFSQTDLSCFENKDAETQCGVEKSTYNHMCNLFTSHFYFASDKIQH